MAELQLSGGLLLSIAVSALKDMTERAIVNYSPDGVSLLGLDPYGFIFAVIRMKSSSIAFFHCNHSGFAIVDIEQLFSAMRPPHEDSLREYYITIYGDVGGFTIGCGLEYAGRRDQIIYREFELVEVLNEPSDIDRRLLEAEYEVVIAISSETFRRIFQEELAFSAESVFIATTDEQVKLSAKDRTVVLSKELGECIIGGVAKEEKEYLTFSIRYKGFYLLTSFLSKVVWILHARDAPPMLNFPVDENGFNVMFYSIC